MEEKTIWYRATTIDRVPDDRGLRADIEGLSIAVFRIEDGYFATEDRCTHGKASLAEGYLEGDEVECPLHQGRFHVPTGKALCRPLTVDIRTFPTKIEGDDVFVGLTEADLRSESARQ